MNIDRRTLPLTALRAFEAFGRLGSMSAAADELAVTHSAVSRQIKRLEALLGLPLIEGPRSATRMTRFGAALLPGLSLGFDQLQLAVQTVPAQEQVVDVSCLSTLAIRWLVPRLFGFQTLHPQTRVRLTSDDGPVRSGPNGPDIAIRVGRGPWPADRAVHDLFGDATGPVIAPAFRPSYDEEILRLPRLSAATRQKAWSDWSDRTGRALEPSKTTEFEHHHVMIEATLAALGVGLVPDILIRPELQSERLIAPFGFSKTGMRYVALSQSAPSPAAETFLNWLTAEAERAKD